MSTKRRSSSATRCTSAVKLVSAKAGTPESEAPGGLEVGVVGVVAGVTSEPLGCNAVAAGGDEPSCAPSAPNRVDGVKEEYLRTAPD